MIDVGDKIPDFTLADEENKQRSIYEIIGSRFTVIYFYPMDFTPGCTKEACSFRDNYDYFEQQKINIVGISADSPSRHKNFKIRNQLPFTLLSDKGNKIRKLFGLKGFLFGIIPDRVTYIVNQEGIVHHKFNRLLQYENHVQEAMKIIKREISAPSGD